VRPPPFLQQIRGVRTSLFLPAGTLVTPVRRASCRRLRPAAVPPLSQLIIESTQDFHRIAGRKESANDARRTTNGDAELFSLQQCNALSVEDVAGSCSYYARTLRKRSVIATRKENWTLLYASAIFRIKLFGLWAVGLLDFSRVCILSLMSTNYLITAKLVAQKGISLLSAGSESRIAAAPSRIRLRNPPTSGHVQVLPPKVQTCPFL